MLLLASIVYLPVIAAITLIAAISSYGRRERYIKSFALFVYLAALWLLCQYLSLINLNNMFALGVIRTSSALSLFIGVFFLDFVRTYTNSRRIVRRRYVVIPTLLLVCLNFTPLMIREVAISANGISVKDAGILYFVQLLILAGCFVGGFIRLVRATLLLAPALRTRNYWLILGIGAAVVPALGGSLLFSSSAQAQDIIPIAVFAMVVLLSIAMLKHSLFDIRLIVARSLAYILSLGSLIGAFFLVAVAVSGLKRDITVDEARWVYALLAVILALVFSRIKHFFDQVTRRVFYRDSYDSQVFLDEFNKLLVSTYELAPLMHKSATMIATNLKSSYVLFDIYATKNTKRRMLGTAAAPAVGREALDSIPGLLSKLRHDKVIIVDTLDEKNAEAKQALQAADVAIVARLSSGHSREAGVGCLLIGSKKSGSFYTPQDLQVLEILANELVIAMQNALRFEEIENFNLTLQQKVDEATRKLRRTNEKLKALDEAKDDFVSMASHQLRTPLTSIKGYTSMVLEGDAGKINATQRKLLEQSFFSSQRMVYLIADLLNVSRLKTGKFIIEPAPVNLAEVVEQEITQLQDTAKGRQLELTYEKPETFPTLMLDETKTRQVIMNFADNAIYYTPAGGHIKVVLSETDTAVEFRVVDDGIGVPKSEQPHLFTKFYRAGNARKARPDGTGLGLFMAKKVIVSEGGAILFATEEGKGSTFGFSFPKATLAAPAETSV